MHFNVSPLHQPIREISSDNWRRRFLGDKALGRGKAQACTNNYLDAGNACPAGGRHPPRHGAGVYL
jgi:hypothetical protein